MEVDTGWLVYAVPTLINFINLHQLSMRLPIINLYQFFSIAVAIRVAELAPNFATRITHSVHIYVGVACLY